MQCLWWERSKSEHKLVELEAEYDYETALAVCPMPASRMTDKAVTSVGDLEGVVSEDPELAAALAASLAEAAPSTSEPASQAPAANSQPGPEPDDGPGSPLLPLQASIIYMLARTSYVADHCLSINGWEHYLALSDGMSSSILLSWTSQLVHAYR